MVWRYLYRSPKKRGLSPPRGVCMAWVQSWTRRFLQAGRPLLVGAVVGTGGGNAIRKGWLNCGWTKTKRVEWKVEWGKNNPPVAGTAEERGFSFARVGFIWNEFDSETPFSYFFFCSNNMLFAECVMFWSLTLWRLKTPIVVVPHR